MSIPMYTEKVGKQVEGVYRLIVKHGVDKVTKSHPELSYLPSDINDMILAYHSWMRNDKKYKFHTSNGGLSIPHYSAFSLLTGMVAFKTQDIIPYEILHHATKMDFLDNAKRAGYDDSEMLAKAFDTTFCPELVTLWCYLFSLIVMDEAPY